MSIMDEVRGFRTYYGKNESTEIFPNSTGTTQGELNDKKNVNTFNYFDNSC